MDEKRKALAHRAGCLRKKYRLAPCEAAWCTLWLAGTRKEKILRLAELLLEGKEKAHLRLPSQMGQDKNLFYILL